MNINEQQTPYRVVDETDRVVAAFVSKIDAEWYLGLVNKNPLVHYRIVPTQPDAPTTDPNERASDTQVFFVCRWKADLVFHEGTDREYCIETRGQYAPRGGRAVATKNLCEARMYKTAASAERWRLGALYYEVVPVTITVGGDDHPDVKAVSYLMDLRAGGWGDSVRVLCDNEEAASADEQIAIEVNAGWTGYEDKRYYGATLLDCLATAKADRALHKLANNA